MSVGRIAGGLGLCVKEVLKMAREAQFLHCAGKLLLLGWAGLVLLDWSLKSV